VKFLGRTIIRKMSVTAVPGLQTEGVLDGAPILLGATGDFLDAGDGSMHVATVGAIPALDAVEILR
jgi:hypothetical protein